jgi:hypothetical protein
VKKELFLFGQFFLFGMGLVLCYDCLRVIRRIFAHGILWVTVEDLLFAAAGGGLFFLRLCQWNDGIWRGYILLGALLGALFYYVCFGRKFMKIWEKIIISAKKRLKKIGKAATMGIKKLRRERRHEDDEKKAP